MVYRPGSRTNGDGPLAPETVMNFGSYDGVNVTLALKFKNKY